MTTRPKKNTMKFPPQPATAYELDAYGNTLLHSKVCAVKDRVSKTKSTPYTGNKAQNKPRKSQDCIIGVSRRSGSLEKMVKACSPNRTGPMTIFTGSPHETSEYDEVPGFRYRKISYLGTYMIL